MRKHFLGIIINPYGNRVIVPNAAILENIQVDIWNGKELYSTVETPVEVSYWHVGETLTIFTNHNKTYGLRTLILYSEYILRD